MQVRELTSPPSLGRLYARGALGMLRSRSRGGGLPEQELLLRDVAIDRERLAEYVRVCGFPLRDRVPATYPHLLAFPLGIELMIDPSFPFPPAGLVHIRNTIVQHRPVTVSDRLTLRAATRNLRSHPKGRQFDVTAEATADSAVVWRSASTYLSRGSSDGEDPAGRSAPEPEAPSDGPPHAEWRAPADTGRRYAAVSGDRNPIHLNPVTARAFGFPRQIAHGMWTKARCLAAFEGRLPAAFTLDAAFKRPVVLPADVAFRSRRTDGGWTFSLRDARRGDPHLVGAISPVA
ncbi:MAG: MaoC/PaaZ C-terminal domain-containing protein [Actinomycetota bacterium]